MAKLTPLEQALDNLHGLQVALMRHAVSDDLTPERAQEISEAIGLEAAIIRRAFASAAKALRGE